jgi:UPF0755 protein
MTRWRWLFRAVGFAFALAAALGVREYLRLASAEVTPSAGIRAVVIEPGSSAVAIGRGLEAAGIVADADDFVLTYRLLSADLPLRAGEYAVEPGTTLRELVAAIQAGSVIQHSLTIVEGMTVRELRLRLQGEPALEQTLAATPDRDLMAALGRAPGHPEGRFLPDTYFFTRGTRDRDLLRRANAALERELAAAWAERIPGLPLDDAEALLALASVVEKETGIAAERPVIAGVFVRRLQKGMRLQTDPTVIYGLGARFDGNLRKQDLMTDGPYNTYTRRGLPPTPICLPGRDALRAAANPARGDALYFVASGDGGHVFSATLEQHNAAVRRFLEGQRAQRRAQPSPSGTR